MVDGKICLGRAPKGREDFVETAGFCFDLPRLSQQIGFVAFDTHIAGFQIRLDRLINFARPALIAAIPMDFIRAGLFDQLVQNIGGFPAPQNQLPAFFLDCPS